jgi:hypothetical protein
MYHNGQNHNFWIAAVSAEKDTETKIDESKRETKRDTERNREHDISKLRKWSMFCKYNGKEYYGILFGYCYKYTEVNNLT